MLLLQPADSILYHVQSLETRQPAGYARHVGQAVLRDIPCPEQERGNPGVGNHRAGRGRACEVKSVPVRIAVCEICKRLIWKIDVSSYWRHENVSIRGHTAIPIKGIAVVTHEEEA